MAGEGVTEVGVWYSVLIVDDHEMFAALLHAALQGEGIEAHLVKPLSTTNILEQAASIPRGLVVLDLDLGMSTELEQMRGADLVGALRKIGWKVLIVSAGQDTRATAAAVASGAIGVIPKTRSFGDLLAAVVRAASGLPVMTEIEYQEWLARDRAYRNSQKEVGRLLGRLSPREREVLEQLNEGLRPVVIAEQAVVSMYTVRTQIRSILAKLEVQSQLEAVALLRQDPRYQPRAEGGETKVT